MESKSWAPWCQWQRHEVAAAFRVTDDKPVARLHHVRIRSRPLRGASSPCRWPRAGQGSRLWGSRGIRISSAVATPTPSNASRGVGRRQITAGASDVISRGFRLISRVHSRSASTRRDVLGRTQSQVKHELPAERTALAEGDGDKVEGGLRFIVGRLTPEMFVSQVLTDDPERYRAVSGEIGDRYGEDPARSWCSSVRVNWTLIPAIRACRSSEVSGGGHFSASILINSAGTFPFGSTASHDEATFDAVYTLNVKAPWVLVAALAPWIAERGSGSVVNVSTMVAQFGMDDTALYGSSKAAFGTPHQGVVSGVRTERRAGERRQPRPPAGRPGSPRRIASAIVYLASDQASFIHGAVLAVDGGRAAT